MQDARGADRPLRLLHPPSRGDAVCPNRTLLPQVEIKREMLDILQQQLLTPDTLEKLLKAVNAKLRDQAAASRPRVAEVRKALAQVDRQIANYTRAIARGDFASLETALGAAEQRRATLQAELAQLDGKQQTAIIQLTPTALEHRLQGMTEQLRSGVKGKVREAIEQAVARILVGVDGSLMIETKPGGLLGLEGNLAQLSAGGAAPITSRPPGHGQPVLAECEIRAAAFHDASDRQVCYRWAAGSGQWHRRCYAITGAGEAFLATRHCPRRARRARQAPPIGMAAPSRKSAAKSVTFRSQPAPAAPEAIPSSHAA